MPAARPWTPSLRVECAALSLIHFLQGQSQSKDEWLDAISADQTISAPVRQRTMQFARVWKCRVGWSLLTVPFHPDANSEFRSA